MNGVERVAKFLIHYPSYIWLVALLGRLDLYFFPYVAVNAVYALRTLASVALRFGRDGASSTVPRPRVPRGTGCDDALVAERRHGAGFRRRRGRGPLSKTRDRRCVATERVA